MGGSGGGNYSPPSRSEIQELISSSVGEAATESFNADLNLFLNDFLKEINDRDHELVNKRLEKIEDMLSDIIDSTFKTVFGGSVSKHTYVDGLSDIDSLLVIKDTALLTENPQHVIEAIARKLQEKGLDATVGTLAVTIKYNDNLEIQILPAIKTNNGIKIATSDGQDWSSINPEKFTNKLTEVNRSCNGNLIPTIKLVKSINASLPEQLQLTGYHIEALAVKAFKSYSDGNTYKDMITHFFKCSAENVKSPIVDKTSQSIHVDDHLGAASTKARMQLSHILNRTYKKISNANTSSTLSDWQELFEED